MCTWSPVLVQVNVLVFEKENLEDLPTYDQIYASDIVRSMYEHMYLCVHFNEYACCMLQCSCMPHVPTRKTQMKKMQTTRAVLKTVHCRVGKGEGKEQK